VELRPCGAAAKGETLAGLLDEFRPAVAFVLGDDRSDAEAFAALKAARGAGRVRGLALAVRSSGEELPEVAAAADLLLASTGDAVRFLSGLARRLGDTDGARRSTRRGSRRGEVGPRRSGTPSVGRAPGALSPPTHQQPVPEPRADPRSRSPR
jgi:hypothetical protein